MDSYCGTLPGRHFPQSFFQYHANTVEMIRGSENISDIDQHPGTITESLLLLWMATALR